MGKTAWFFLMLLVEEKGAECQTTSSVLAVYNPQSFIQSLLLTSVFHEGLSFMVAGHNPTCVSSLGIATGVSYGAL